jgi:hypothetical protein
VTFASPKLITLLIVAMALAATACGSSSGSSSSSGAAGGGSASTTASVGHLPTVKFALHAGLAFGAFHRYIYKPFKNGSFSGGLLKHKVAAVKAGLAGLFAYHELKLAAADARASPTLSKLLAPVNALTDKVKSIGSGVKSGDPAAAISSANSDITSLSGLAGQSGLSLPDQLPSASQLAGGGSG